MGHNDYLSILNVVSFFKHLIQNQLYLLPPHTSVTPVVSEKSKSFFILFVASLHSYDYGVAYFRLTSFILSVFLSKTISKGFVAITARKVSFFLFWR